MYLPDNIFQKIKPIISLIKIIFIILGIIISLFLIIGFFRTGVMLNSLPYFLSSSLLVVITIILFQFLLKEIKKIKSQEEEKVREKQKKEDKIKESIEEYINKK